MTYEELRRLAKQTNWEKSRLLFILLKKVMELLREDDFKNSYVRHLFNDENNELELYILSTKNKLFAARYLYNAKTSQITVYDLTAVEKTELTESAEGDKVLTVTFTDGAVIRLNSRENYDNEHKNFLIDFTRDLIDLA
ncbi:hypothetical protein [Dethiobacter alkaliphilus]|uniref:YokE-like PH domain-containing protein n=1 Tax=Dethiobacter alkaliphilus AHT 1 TaxID=555088 RepID=C0GHX8_DETAL|nr:hypothetical protein [Dethiobacter alkaliphilus]EEG77052.1 hypothetical protein DealDRAFT_2087 [Dethiobacter alkaliphilus AHT 1]